jgi:hypothetical protein
MKTWSNHHMMRKINLPKISPLFLIYDRMYPEYNPSISRTSEPKT